MFLYSFEETQHMYAEQYMSCVRLNITKKKLYRIRARQVLASANLKLNNALSSESYLNYAVLSVFMRNIIGDTN